MQVNTKSDENAVKNSPLNRALSALVLRSRVDTIGQALTSPGSWFSWIAWTFQTVAKSVPAFAAASW
jgi:hypothetical protein